MYVSTVSISLSIYRPYLPRYTYILFVIRYTFYAHILYRTSFDSKKHLLRSIISHLLHQRHTLAPLHTIDPFKLNSQFVISGH